MAKVLAPHQVHHAGLSSDAFSGPASPSQAAQRALDFEAWLDSLEALALTADAVSLLALLEEHRGTRWGSELSPELQLRLRRLQMLERVRDGDLAGAHAVAQGALSLTESHSSLFPLLQVHLVKV
jgi:hypothetical protein